TQGFFLDAEGNPGMCLYTLACCDTAMLVTGPVASPFRGDFRTQRVDSLGLDLITFASETSFAPLSLILSGGGHSVGIVGPHVPQEGAPWTSYDFDIPSQSTVLPPGWVAISSPASPDAAWNAVITDVTEVRYMYGSFLGHSVHEWEVGADNIRISSTVWTDIGNALPGAQGAPLLGCWGGLAAGTLAELHLQNARPLALVTVIAGLSAPSVPFKGGVLVPAPDVVVPGVVTNASGYATVATTWPAGVPSDLSLVVQAWIVDPTGPSGFTASNAMRGTTP
ncbi:MAG TPA: hypothetical protein VK824_06975, partial [Planctomycetota bacterium]|nr:hypothetical protein [Planctomycetota bacterium]